MNEYPSHRSVEKQKGREYFGVWHTLDENYRFLIYWSHNPLPIFDFDYDKLNTLEIRALAVLDDFWVVKVKDLLQMVEDSDQISNFLGNVHLWFFTDF